jgi:hypothetical protein
MTYYSAWDASTNTGTTTATPDQVRAIRLQIATKSEESVAAYGWGSQGTVMESMVRLRNK